MRGPARRRAFDAEAANPGLGTSALGDFTMARPRPQRRPRRSLFSRAVRLASALIGLLTVAAGLAVLRLSAAPLSLDAWAPSIETQLNAAIAAQAPDWRVDVDGASVTLDLAAGGLGVQLAGVSVSGPDGAAFSQAPALGATLSLARALVGDLVVIGLTLDGAEAAAVRDAAGAWRLALAPMATVHEDVGALVDGARQAPATDPAALLENPAADFGRMVSVWTGAPADGPLGRLERISVRGASLRFQDLAAEAGVVAPDASFEFERLDGGGVTATLEAAVALDGADAPPARLRLTAVRGAETSEVAVDAAFERAPAAMLALFTPDLDAAAALDAALSGEAQVRFDLDSGDLTAFAAELEGEGAEFAARVAGGAALVESSAGRDSANPGANAARMAALSRFEAALTYDPERDAIALDRLEIAGKKIQAELRGRAFFMRAENGAALGAAGALHIDAARFSDAAVFSEPLEIAGGVFDFRLLAGDPASGGAPRLSVSGLKVETPDVVVSGEADVVFDRPASARYRGGLGEALGVRADVALALSDFDARRLPALWPLPAAPGGRAWVAAHIKSGAVVGGRLRARLGGGVASLDPAGGATAEAPSGETVDFDFRAEDVTATYLEEMTAITGASGPARVTAERFDLTLETAQVDLGDAGRLRLDGSTFAIPDFAPDIPPGEIVIRSAGPIRALLTLIDQDPLGFPGKLGLDYSAASGDVTGVTRLALPLKADLPIDAVSVAAEATLISPALPVAPLGGRIARAERAELSVDVDGLTLRGRGVLAGYEDAPLDVLWDERFAPTADQDRTRLTLSGPLTVAALHGYGAPRDLLIGGSVAAEALLVVRDDAPVGLSATFNLAKAATALPPLGWMKPAGAPGRLELAGVIDGARLRFQKLEAQAGDLTASGAAAANIDGGLTDLTLDKLAIGDETQLSLSLTQGGDGALKIAGGGPSLDLRPLIASASANAASGVGGEADGADAGAGGTALAADTEDPPLTVSLKVDRAMLDDGAALTAVALELQRGADGGVDADLDARAGAAPLSASLRTANGLRTLNARTPNAGEALRALGVVEDAARGAAVLTARETSPGRFRGQLDVTGLVIVNAPALADLVSVATVVGIFDRASSGGISFDRLTAPFEVTPERITVSEAVATGPSLGMTLDGHVRRSDWITDFGGSVSPAFVLNGLPSRVPVIGQILTGGSGEGVLGVAFRIQGPLSDPKMTVNPLSALTPGPLRKLFGG